MLSCSSETRDLPVCPSSASAAIVVASRVQVRTRDRICNTIARVYANARTVIIAGQRRLLAGAAALQRRIAVFPVILRDERTVPLLSGRFYKGERGLTARMRKSAEGLRCFYASPACGAC